MPRQTYFIVAGRGLCATARRYLVGESTVHLLGRAPIRFGWRLDHPLPPEVFHYAKATAG